ncbi:MAG: diguanylate cyclase [Desulfobacteraceae bacterium]|nr:MAG: diguanylate cyclase [Desulfobacteraceae bacterium]
MGNAKSDTQERLNALRRVYAGQLTGKVMQIRKGLDELRQGRGDERLLEQVIREAHTMAGSAATFGFVAVGHAARSLEVALKASEAGPRRMEAVNADRIVALIDALEQACAQSRSDSGNPGVPLASNRSEIVSPKDERKMVFVADDDAILVQGLALQLEHFGYHVTTFPTIAALTEGLKATVPSVILMDIVFPESDTAGINAATQIRSASGQSIPIVFMSCREDFDARLRAARAGGDAYFTKPVPLVSLIDKLDILTTKVVVDPYRILIVDDDADLARYYSLILEHEGMVAEVVSEPSRVMSHLSRFSPDLILMDMYMPDCNGFELSKVIRQMDTYVSLPIVFLSVETNIEKQFSAMRTGGDDFLTKPIQPEHLIASIGIRAARMRSIRSFMDRDSLTGLLNHTKTKTQLDIAVDKAVRQSGKLAFAMIDIDRFKSVNDTYGHPAGDGVIVKLAKLLQQRLRKVDVIGRYGGEEFAVILDGTDAMSAAKVLNEIRTSFSAVKHQSGGREFFVTFSCGVAAYPQYRDAKTICAMADKALYQAKTGGRNQVVVSTAESGK